MFGENCKITLTLGDNCKFTLTRGYIAITELENSEKRVMQGACVSDDGSVQRRTCRTEGVSLTEHGVAPYAV